MNHLLERKIGTLKVFDIPFVGLKKAIHRFEYVIDSSFFQEFENSPVHESALEVFLDFNKKHNFFELDFHIEGKIKSQCDRCSDDFYLKIDLDDQAIIKLANSEKISEENDLDIFHLAVFYAYSCFGIGLTNSQNVFLLLLVAPLFDTTVLPLLVFEVVEQL